MNVSIPNDAEDDSSIGSIQSTEDAIRYLRYLRELPEQQFLDCLETEQHCQSVRLVQELLPEARAYLHKMSSLDVTSKQFVEILHSDAYKEADAIVFGCIGKEAFVEYMEHIRERRKLVDKAIENEQMHSLRPRDSRLLDSIIDGTSHHHPPCIDLSLSR